MLLTALALILSVATTAAPKQPVLNSPDGRITVSVSVDGGVKYCVSKDGVQLLAPSGISMTLSDGTVYGGPQAKLQKVSFKSIDNVIPAVAYKKAQVPEKYNEMTLKFKAFSLIFRAYDDGVAYRFVSASKAPFTVKDEQADFTFPQDWNSYVPYVTQNDETLEGQFHNSFENIYKYEKIFEFDDTHFAFLPILVDAPNGVKLCITESDLLHYPGMYLYKGDKPCSYKSVFAPYPKNRVPEPGDRVISMYVEGTEDYIAKCEPACSFPWRVIGISDSDGELLESDLVWLLASPAEAGADFSWVKPGKVAWDWWNEWNLYGVDFRAGVNTETYKAYVDFASQFGIEYVILDEGWSDATKADLRTVIDAVDLKALIAYAEKKNVGIILWAGFYPFQKDIEGICKHYAAMGVKGFKVDFMDSDDQQIPEFLERSAKAAAENHLMLDFHGIYKPTGLSRKYPNVVNYEGIHGLEQMKWNATPSQVDYDVTVPFIRFFAGPADYTQGAMRNAIADNLFSAGTEAMSPGTRCHQLGEYVVFFSPLNMLCDNPSNYQREPECTRFIASVPTVWDETVALENKVGQYASVARRHGNDWFVGAVGNWQERDLTIDLSFLGEGDWQIELFKDGINADRAARDYKKCVSPVPTDRKLTVHLAPGGGFAAKITRK
ncbi:MAG: glycoside hydrolase family 97 protein [Bacteroidales bacterium]|nr:glycoside hydrolase family 97 protein [Candidatus Cacconaster scatequi]